MKVKQFEEEIKKRKFLREKINPYYITNLAIQMFEEPSVSSLTMRRILNDEQK